MWCRVAYVLMSAVALLAQQDRGTLTGVVKDPSAAPVSGVKITVTHMGTNARYESATNSEGQYTIPNLPIGSYRLVFQSAGFKPVSREPLELRIAEVIRVDVNLELGGLTEAVEVRAETPLLRTDTPETGIDLSSKDLTGMPLGFGGGRYAENFAYKLTPGVGGNFWESRIQGGAAFSKAVILDGADATIYIGGQFGESGPSLEAFEEFKVQTSGMSAEYGRTGGGIFNFVMKSGTNQVHGSAVGLLHNEWMDANSFVNNYYGRPRQRDRRHDWGGSLGGPVMIPKLYRGVNRTFFYAAYERYKESYAGGGSPSVTAPLDEFWSGDLSRLLSSNSIGVDAMGRNVAAGAVYDPATTRVVDGRMVRDPFAGNRIPLNRISGPAQKLGAIFRQHYSPTLKGANGLVPLQNNSFFPIANQAGFTQNQFSIRMDHSLSAAQKLSGSYVYVDRPRALIDSGGVWDFNDAMGGPLSRARLQWVRSWYGRLAHDWTLGPSLLNHLQLGFNRQRNPSLSAHLDENGVQALGLQGLTRTQNYPEIHFGGSYLVNYPTLGLQTNDFGAGQNYQIIDTVSWIRGRHSIRAGVDWRRSYLRWRTDNGPAQIDFSQTQTGLQGFAQTGSSFASMLLGDAAIASVPMSTPTGSRYLNLALFAQDDFRVSSRLTLNLGLRWDYQPLPVEQYNRLGNWNPSLIDPAWNLPGAMEFASAERRTFAPNHYKDFSPRVGFAWQVAKRVVVRGAYGIFYLARNGNGWSGVPWGQPAGFGQDNRVTAPVDYLAAWNWSSPYPGVIRNLARNASIAGGSPGVWGIVSYDPNAAKNGYAQQWNLNIQRELGYGFLLDVGYVGSKSTAIQANELRRLNQLDPKFLRLGDSLGVGVTSQAELPADVAAAGGRYPFGNAGIWIPAYQSLLPHPQMMAWNEIKSAFVPLGFSTYHALQAQLNRRFASGLSVLSNYTFSKSIDNVRSAFGDTWGANWGRPMDAYNLRLDKSVSDADRTHVVKLAIHAEIPYRGRMRAVLGGWAVQFIGNYSSGFALGVDGTPTPNSNFAANRGSVNNPRGEALSLGWDSSRIDMSRINQPNPQNRYVNTSLFADPASMDRYARGNTSNRLSQLRGPWEMSEDVSLQKNIRVRERLRVQLRAEFLNAFNRTLWSTIEGNAASPLFGQVTGANDSFSPRKVQLGVRADW